MKRLMLSLALAGFVLVGFSQEKYRMWEAIYIVPKAEKMEELKKGMAEHNEKYHSEAPFTAHVWSIHTGPHEGTWLWAMGPCTFSDLDSRPGKEGHDEDWDKNITPYVEDVYGVKYWRENEELSYMPEGEAPQGKAIWSIFDIKPFEGYRFKEMIKKVVKVYEEMDYPYSFTYYESQFDSDDGEDVVLEWMFDKWSWFDRESGFVKKYEEVHGEGSWTYFMEEYKDCVDGVFDEIGEYQADLSGSSE
jgi:hypothetical protein